MQEQPNQLTLTTSLAFCGGQKDYVPITFTLDGSASDILRKLIANYLSIACLRVAGDDQRHYIENLRKCRAHVDSRLQNSDLKILEELINKP